MERTDVQRMADSVLRDYGVPLKVSTISAAEAGWTIAFAWRYPGSPLRQVQPPLRRAQLRSITSASR